jgi:hypothetical protein
MYRLGEFKVPKWIGVPAANMLSVGLYPLLIQPDSNFIITDNERLGTPGDGDRVANMVPVTMRYKEIIRSYFIGSRTGSRVTGEKRINDQSKSASFKTNCSVTKPGYFCIRCLTPLLSLEDNNITKLM